MHGSCVYRGPVAFFHHFRNLARRAKASIHLLIVVASDYFAETLLWQKPFCMKLSERPGHQSLSFVFATKGFLNSFEESIARCVMKTKHKEKERVNFERNGLGSFPRPI